MSDNPSLADVKARRAEIAKLLKPLQDEDQELAAAEAVLLRLIKVEGATQSAAEPADEGRTVVEIVKEIMKGDETIEELMTLLMQESGDPWWTAAELQSHLTDVRKRVVPMSSVSPTLTNMKIKHLLVRNGLKVALTSRVQKNEAAAAE